MKCLFKMIFDDFFGEITLINDAVTNFVVLLIIGMRSLFLAY
jgi:hypothetical protein